MEFNIENVLIMKSWKKKTSERKELSNQERIRALGEKEIFKYLGILQVDIIKLTEMKEKGLKNFLEEPENSKPSFSAEISSKELAPRYSP